MLVKTKRGRLVAQVRNRSVANGSIVRIANVNYTVLHVDYWGLIVEKREGAFGQVATPDYVLDEVVEGEFDFRVHSNASDIYIGQIHLDHPPEVNEIVEVKNKKYRVVDWSIGQRLVDELYVVDVRKNET